MLQLTKNEAALYERLKISNDVRQIASEIGITKEAAYFLLKKLVELEAVRRSGTKRSYVLTPIPLDYEIVKQRTRPKVIINLEDDALVNQSRNVHLTEEQLYYIKHHHNKVPRYKLAKRMGLTKLQLNFALIKLEDSR